MSLYVLFTILVAHYVADFLLQSDYMAKNKSKSSAVLAQHVFVYTSALAVLMYSIILFSTQNGYIWIVAWAGLNGGAHFVVDFFTSRMTSSLFGKGDYHNGFVVIGADQLIHYACLILSWVYLFGN